MSISAALSYLRSCLVSFKCVRPVLGNAWSRSGNTAPIVVDPDGGPRAKEHSAGAVSLLAWPARGESGMCFPADIARFGAFVLLGLGDHCIRIPS